MARKNISLAGPVGIGVLSLSSVDFSKQEVYVYLTEGVRLLGIKTGNKEFLLVQPEEFISFQDGLSFELESGDRVALYRVENQLEIRRI